MAYKVIILYSLYMPSYFLGAFTEYACLMQSTVSYKEMSASNFFKIALLAMSMTEFSNEARYILVVFSDECPMPALITEIGMLWSLADVAHVCRAT